MPKKEKDYKPLLIIGILAVTAALIGMMILDPPWIREEPMQEETPARFQTVLSPEDLRSSSRTPETPGASVQSPAPDTSGMAAGDTAGVSAHLSPPSASPSASARVSESAPAEDADASGSPAPVVSHGGGLIPTAGAAFTITTDSVEDAGGMKLIEGLRANGTATLRDIRNNLVSSSSLVKGYKDSEEIGGFELIGTGTVLELSSRAGEVVDTAVVLMPGDVLGTGLIEISQLTRLAQAASGDDPLQDVYAMAGDVDQSGTIDEGDVMMLASVLTRRTVREAQQ